MEFRLMSVRWSSDVLLKRRSELTELVFLAYENRLVAILDVLDPCPLIDNI